MKVELGRYELDLDFDPRVERNSTDEMIPIEDIGFVYNCVFKQKAAFVHSVERIREVYPDSKLYCVSDGGLDYSFLQDENLETIMEDDTLSILKHINPQTYKQPEMQAAIKKGIAATLDRVERGIKFCGNPEWTCVTEPDVLIRGKVSYPKGAKLLGSRVNYAWLSEECLDMFMGMNGLLGEIEGAIPVVRWGAVPVIFHTETFLKALKVYRENFDLLDKLTEHHYNPGVFDLLFPLVFALVGEEEVYTSEITECLRNPQWYTSDHPVVHQYREYYEDSDWVSKPS